MAEKINFEKEEPQMNARAFFVIIVIIASFTLLWGEQSAKAITAKENVFTHQNSINREIITIFAEDFEEGATGWVHYDETAPTDWNEEWHLSTTGAWEGNSWWMGDEELGGYTSHRYLVLDTPVITLSADPELNFMCNLDCEDPGGDPPYDAWDGANVRISTDGGVTWEVIEGSPAYNGTSFYSFGYEFNEGPGIPGWGGTNYFHGWQAANFDLSAYAGQEVKIRFCFASDPAYDTSDDPGMFGFRIDDITIDTNTGQFISNGDGAAGDEQMIPGYGGETAGNLWHVYEDASAPSPTHAMGCFDDDTNTYLPGMSNFIISPEIELPEEGQLSWDVGIVTMLDQGTFPDCDYIHVELRSQIPGDNWSAWTSISNPLNNPSGTNYVFTGSIENWDTFINGWGMEYADLTMLAGRNIQFRFGLHTNAVDEVMPGGFRIDDFYIQQEFFQGPGPENLMAENINGEVYLSWNPIIEGGSEGWIQWDSGVNADAIGLTNGGSFWAAARFDAADMIPYTGGEITELEVYIADMPDEMIVHIWNGYLAGNELLNQIYIPNANSWNNIILDTPIPIESLMEYWIGYEITNEDSAHSAGTDAGPAVQGKGDFIATSEGAWNELYTYDLDYNWNIHAFVNAEGRRLPLFHANNREREITGYNVWRSDISGDDYELIGTVPQDDYPFFTDSEPLAGAWNYYVVTALYDGIDGEFSNEAAVFVIGNDMLELGYDDGSAEAAINVGIAQYMGVQFMPDFYNDSCVLTHAKFYIESPNSGQYVFRIYEDDAGSPAENYLAQFVISGSSMNLGWNTVAIPEESLPYVTFDSGAFWITIFEMANAPALGKDTGSAEGQSYITTSGVWTPVTDGNLMIRALLFYPGGLGTYGDVDSNGVIDAYDASLVLMNAVGMTTPVEPFPVVLGDVDGNGNVEAYDAALILQYVVGIIDQFPVETRYHVIPQASLNCCFEADELVISAEGLMYSALLEFPLDIENRISFIHSEFISAIKGSKIAIASYLPYNGEILRIKLDNNEINQPIITSVNSLKGKLICQNTLPTAALCSIYPNPFNPETAISYQVNNPGLVRIDIYNLKGQKVTNLVNDIHSPGAYKTIWHAAHTASGIYFVRLKAGTYLQQSKILLIK
jgi:hypothetical protein